MKSFPRRGAAAVDRAVKPADVVPTLDVVEHRRVQSLAGRPGSGLDQFTLDRGTEGLGHGVLPGTHIDEGKVRSFVNVYLNDEDIRYLSKDSTAAKDADTISLVPSI